uniref:Phosphoglycolate phosphatase n=1 Tax=Corethron hystrix TaxID=216773 RepID=A0A7S1BKS3_9STRA|mmetsp:Transcript_30578/g.69973  ORF Transcript_30578/g.69973 Transcript_30578/m.69973 type:complete len:447 (+) Transcript_30578:131-1471(+)
MFQQFTRICTMISASAFISSVSRHRLPLMSATTARFCSNTYAKASPPQKEDKPKLRGVIFDMDGTLAVPNLDFAVMYERCGVDRSDDILAAVVAMPPAEAARANKIIDEMEEEGRRTLKLCTGAAEAGRWLADHGVPTALVTRNTIATARDFERLWTAAGVRKFDAIVARDHPSDPLPPKPDPASLHGIAESWGLAVPSDELLMVGDSISNDVAYGKNGGIQTALLQESKRGKEEKGKDFDSGASITVNNIAELPAAIWNKFHISSELGTSHTLIKYKIPVPLTLADEAAATGDVETLKSMMRSELNGAEDVEGVNNTPLIWAADRGHVEAVRYLLQETSDNNIDCCGFIGCTAVSRAARQGNIDILRLLLAEGGADPNIPNIKMQYPLHIAAFHRNAEAVDTLLEFGANSFVMDRKGRTPAEDTDDASIQSAIFACRASTADKVV